MLASSHEIGYSWSVGSSNATQGPRSLDGFFERGEICPPHPAAAPTPPAPFPRPQAALLLARRARNRPDLSTPNPPPPARFRPVLPENSRKRPILPGHTRARKIEPNSPPMFQNLPQCSSSAPAQNKPKLIPSRPSRARALRECPIRPRAHAKSAKRTQNPARPPPTPPPPSIAFVPPPPYDSTIVTPAEPSPRQFVITLESTNSYAGRTPGHCPGDVA